MGRPVNGLVAALVLLVAMRTADSFGPSINDNRIKNAYGHFCGIDHDERLLCWGRSLTGEKDILEPKVISRGRWSQVGVGLSHVCALNKDDAFIYCMGEGYSGQLGDGGPVGEPSSLNTMTPIVGGKKFTSLSVGDDHTCAIGATENAFCWGSNEFGQLGNGDNVSSSTPLKVFSDVDSWKTISAGTQHTCGTRNGIEAWCWGNNEHQEVNSSPEKSVLTPSKVAGSWRGVTAGDGYTLAVDGTGKGFGWGLNELIDVDFAYGGMLGDNSSSMCFDPRTGELCQAADTVAAESDTLSTADGLVDLTVQRTENIVPIAGNRLWQTISAGGGVPCGIELGTGKMFCWGYTLGEAYVAGSPQSLDPVPLEGSTPDEFWVSVSSGIAGSRCGIQQDGLGYCWGLNDFDCEGNCPLGDGTRNNSPTPVQVKGVKDWLAPGTEANATVAPGPIVDAEIPGPIIGTPDSGGPGDALSSSYLAVPTSMAILAAIASLLVG